MHHTQNSFPSFIEPWFTHLKFYAVLTFIGTWNVGTTIPGKPYVARFPDEHGNLKCKDIPQPDVVSKYFKDSDAVDNHNKSQQGDLALEEHWRTVDCWLKLVVTYIGITVTDTWNSVRHHCSDESGFREMSIKRFAECIVFDLWNKPWDKKRPKALVLGMPNSVDDDFEGVEVVLDSPNLTLEKILNEHVLVKTSRREKGK